MNKTRNKKNIVSLKNNRTHKELQNMYVVNTELLNNYNKYNPIISISEKDKIFKYYLVSKTIRNEDIEIINSLSTYGLLIKEFDISKKISTAKINQEYFYLIKNSLNNRDKFKFYTSPIRYFFAQLNLKNLFKNSILNH